MAEAGSSLPPLHTQMPHWSRVGNFDKSRYPKPFLKDKLQPLPGIDTRSSTETGDQRQEDQVLEYGDINPWQRVQHLERSMLFLRQQHSDTLNSLHEEVELLRRENKDLHFKYVMLQQTRGTPPPGSNPSSAHSRKNSAHADVHNKHEQHRGRHTSEKELTSVSLRTRTVDDAISDSQDDRNDELRIVFLEDEIRSLKSSLKESLQRNEKLKKVLEQEKAKRVAEQQAAAAKADSPSALAEVPLPPGVPPIISLHPLQVQPPGGVAPRPPTLKECEGIIRHLHAMSEKQAHELMRLKSDLKDVLYSSKWTPDAYLLARAYIADDDDDASRVPLKMQGTKKIPDVAYNARDTVLPALKQTVSNKAIDRRKRTQILQKTRRKEAV